MAKVTQFFRSLSMANLARFFRSLSPLGPIFGKELRSTSRRRRTYYLRFFYIGLLLLIMMAFYGDLSSDIRQVGSVARRAQKLAERGAVFFAVFAFFFGLGVDAIGDFLVSKLPILKDFLPQMPGPLPRQTGPAPLPPQIVPGQSGQPGQP